MRKPLYILIFLISLLVIIRPAHAGTIIKPVFNAGLVGYWDFQEGAGMTAGDKSGKDNDGVWSGSAGRWTEGIVGRAASFDGGGEYVSASDVNEIDGVSQFSISAWYYRTSSSHVVVMEKGASNNRINLNLSGTTLYASVANGLNSAAYLTYTGTGWNHIVMVFDGTQSTNIEKLKVYINGNYMVAGFWNDSAVPSTTGSNSNHFLIGRSDTYSANSTGKIDEVRIYNRPLSASEITRLYKLSQPKFLAAPKNGLVGYWSFNEGSGTKAGDMSGNGNHGTISNATNTTGRVGNALNFNGTSSYVDLDAVVSDIGAGSVTLSAWVKLTLSHNSSSAVKTFFSLNDSPSTNDLLLCFAGSGSTVCSGTAGALCFWALSGSSGKSACSSTTSWSANAWYHVVAVIDTSGGGQKIYLNGVQVGSNSNTSRGSTLSTKATIGAENDDGPPLANYFPGIIDEVRVYNRALEQSEITALYNSGLIKINSSQNNKLTDGLVGSWSFNGPDIDGDTAIDRSGQNNNGTITGATRTIGKVGQALSFNGSSDYITMGDVLDMGTNDVSMCGWFKTNGAITNGGIVGKSRASGASGRWSIFFEGNALISIFDATGSDLKAITATGTYNDSNYHYFCNIYDRDGLSNLYMDGISRGTIDISAYSATDMQSTHQLLIGAYQNSSGNPYLDGYVFNGVIDEVRIYNRVLSADEIKRLYNMGR